MRAGGLKILTELDFRSVESDTLFGEKNPATDEMKAWPLLGKSRQETWHKACLNSHISGTNKTLPPNTCLGFKTNLL